MSIGNVVESQKAASTKGRVSYGIEIRVGSFTLNEWGLHESQAKQVHEKLLRDGDKPFTVGGITFSRRAPSELSAELAAMLAAPAAPQP